jgi:hypothetical protein
LEQGGKLAYNKALKPIIQKLFGQVVGGKEFKEKDFMKEEFEKKLAK